MLKKTISYTDYNGVERKEDHYFNLSEAELIEMQASEAGGLAEKLERIVAEQDMPSIMGMFKDIILRAYGMKSPDGKRMIKKLDGKRLADEFVETEAYSKLIVELMRDPKGAADFINGIIPQNIDLPKDN